MNENDYYRVIKERLCDWRKDFQEQGYDIIFSKLAANMEKLYHIETTDQKLRAMFTLSNEENKERKVPLAEMVALCHMLQIPLSDICEFPNAPSLELNPPWIKQTGNASKNDNVMPFRDSHYYGDYYCYYFTSRHISKPLRESNSPSDACNIEMAKLNISEKNGMSYVTLQETQQTLYFYQEKYLDQLTLEGRLYLINSLNEVYSVLMDEKGRRIVTLLFDFQKYTKGIMYYRTAARMTVSLNTTHDPLFQKMIMFRVEQDLTDPHICDLIRGILTLNTNDILIKKSEFIKLMEEDPEYEKIYGNEQLYLEFNEKELLNRSLPWSFEERINRILKLRQKSTQSGYEIVAEEEYFSKFAKALQQKNEKNDRGRILKIHQK